MRSPLLVKHPFKSSNMLKRLYKIYHFTLPYTHHHKFPTIGNNNMADARTLFVGKKVTPLSTDS
jgi:hypothetical protein